VKETADYVCSKHPGLKNVGILATEGTLKTALWQDELQRRGVNTVVLSDRHQTEYFNEVVYGRNGLKAGFHNGAMKNKLLTGCRQLADRGAEAIIGGCSELHLLISEEDVPVPYIDAIRVTAAKLSDLYYGQFPANEPAHPPVKG
jgi:aspartate racemase